MSNFMQKRLAIALVLFAGSIFQGYKPIGSVGKKYKTVSEKRKLFKDVGCEYSNALNIQYSDFDQLDPKDSDVYRYDKKRSEAYTHTYAGAVQLMHHAPMYLKWISNVVGYGVFAEDSIKKGDLIGEYSGVLREVQKTSDNLDYAWYYSLDGLNEKKLVVDGKNEGNELRFINHANNPNTVRIDVLGKDGIFHVVYVASRDIKKDEQLTVSYGEGYFTSRDMKVIEV